MRLIDIMRSSGPSATRAYNSNIESSIDWHELMMAVRNKTKLSYLKISNEVGIRADLLRHIGSDKCTIDYQPKFDNGIALIVYASEIGADLASAIRLPRAK